MTAGGVGGGYSCQEDGDVRGQRNRGGSGWTAACGTRRVALID